MKGTLLERFEAKVVKNDEGCWGWTAAVGANRPQMWNGKRVTYGYRIAWELYRGPIPDGLDVLHHCDNGMCCRPDHLFLGTHQDNMLDMARKRRHNYGIRVKGARLDPDRVRYIRAAYRIGKTTSDIARELGVKFGTVAKVLKGETWKEVE